MNFTIAMAAVLLIWPFSSGKNYPMTASPAVPAAKGSVKAQKDKDNGNIKLDIKVDHLARPGSLTPSADYYIVWVRPNGGEPAKEGAIGVDNHLSGELKTETTAKDFDVFITAEQSKSATEPSGQEVLKAHVSMN